ncbi:hypothetical protein PR048_012007 [Dryococelus australis]|uniref:RNA-directed DNA polymerase n=1 Tax=Dryococelus australis TaxID=614101 RepID=A0ABQ9HN95_9NEOP|nr:hypothetical protein PR048_012007 [Dryococelus australis]
MWLYSHPKQVGKIGRWIAWLNRLCFKTTHVNGKDNAVADCLSRMYDEKYYNIKGQENFVGFEGQAEFEEEDLLKQELPVGKRNIGKSGKKIVVPEKARNMLMKYFHDSMVSGHTGITNTNSQIDKEFFWPNLKDDIHHCLFALGRVFVNMYGPLPMSLNGNNCILILIDAFSKFMVM